MAKTTGKRGEAATAIWAVIALVAVAAFMAYLATQSEPSVVATPVTEEDTAGPVMGMPGQDSVSATVNAAQFNGAQQNYVGQIIELQNVTVMQNMGTELVMVQLPAGPYVVKVGGMVGQPPQNAQVTITGRVLQKAGTVLDAWQEGGLITPGQRMIVEIGETYIEARQIRPAG